VSNIYQDPIGRTLKGGVANAERATRANRRGTKAQGTHVAGEECGGLNLRGPGLGGGGEGGGGGGEGGARGREGHRGEGLAGGEVPSLCKIEENFLEGFGLPKRGPVGERQKKERAGGRDS